MSRGERQAGPHADAALAEDELSDDAAVGVDVEGDGDGVGDELLDGLQVLERRHLRCEQQCEQQV